MYKTILLVYLAAMFLACNDPCKDVSCQNDGVCVEGDCECAPGYTGELCSDELRDSFVGVWSGIVECPNQSLVRLEVPVLRGAEDIFDILVNVNGRSAQNVSITGNSFSYSATGLSGTFTLDGNFLRASVDIPLTTGNQSGCTGILDKP